MREKALSFAKKKSPTQKGSTQSQKLEKLKAFP